MFIRFLQVLPILGDCSCRPKVGDLFRSPTFRSLKIEPPSTMCSLLKSPQKCKYGLIFLNSDAFGRASRISVGPVTVAGSCPIFYHFLPADRRGGAKLSHSQVGSFLVNSATLKIMKLRAKSTESSKTLYASFVRVESFMRCVAGWFLERLDSRTSISLGNLGDNGVWISYRRSKVHAFGFFN